MSGIDSDTDVYFTELTVHTDTTQDKDKEFYEGLYELFLATIKEYNDKLDLGNNAIQKMTPGGRRGIWCHALRTVNLAIGVSQEIDGFVRERLLSTSTWKDAFIFADMVYTAVYFIDEKTNRKIRGSHITTILNNAKMVADARGINGNKTAGFSFPSTLTQAAKNTLAIALNKYITKENEAGLAIAAKKFVP